MEIIKFIQQTNTIYFRVNNVIYKAQITEIEKNNFIIYIFNFKKNFCINLNQKFIPAQNTDNDTKKIFNKNLKSPLAGRVIKIYVKEKDFIKKNQPLLTIESMKMENEIRADFDLFIKEVKIKENDILKQNQVLIEFEI